MVENNQTQSPFFIAERYSLISEFADKVNRVSGGVFDYQTYKNKYAELISKKPEFEEWESFLKKFFISSLDNACIYLITFATKNKNLKETFRDELKRLNEIKKRVDVNNLKYEDLVSIKIEIDDIGKVIEEKVAFCKKDNFWKWVNRIGGFLIGIITTIIISLIMKKFGFC